VARSGDDLTLTWNTLAGAPYLLQYKTNLLQAGWRDLCSPITATTNTLIVLDTNAFKNSPQRFYRLSVSP